MDEKVYEYTYTSLRTRAAQGTHCYSCRLPAHWLKTTILAIFLIKKLTHST